jgi:3-hydroxyisobutyrate dehydrogenase
MDLARNIGKASHSPLPLGEAAREIYEEAVQRRPDLAKKDFSSVYVHLTDL